MATKSSKAKKTASAKTASEAKAVETSVAKTVETAAAVSAPKVAVKRELDPNEYVSVKNGFNGTLVYKSKKTGERFVWEAFGDEQDMELSELKSARNSCKAFFINNWFLFDDPEIVEWLGMTQYYKYALNTEEFDQLFTKSAEEIEMTVKSLSEGQKKSMAFRAKQLIDEGQIDSMKVIAALESSLGLALIEH